MKSTEKTLVALSGAGAIVLCYTFSTVSIFFLLVLVAIDLALVVAGARFGLMQTLAPLLRRHKTLFWIFLRSLWLQKGQECRLLLLPAEAPRLFGILDRMAQQFGVPMPREVSIEMGGNAWVRLEGQHKTGKTVLAIGYDLLAALSEGQVEAVLAHEMGHARFVRRGIKRWLGNGLRRISVLTVQLSAHTEKYRSAGKNILIEETLLRCSDKLTRLSAALLARYSRQDEFEADRVSAEMFGSECLSSALIHLEGLASKLRRLPWSERVARLETEASFNEWLRNELRASSGDSAALQLASARDPYSTHPMLSDRIAALPPDNGVRRSTASALELLKDPDRVARNLVAEIHRVAGEQEEKDAEALAKWTRKTQRGATLRTAQLPGLGLIMAGFLVGGLYPFADDSIWIGLLIGAFLIVAGVFAWRLGRYRDRLQIPVPSFKAIKRSWQSGPPADMKSMESRLESELKLVMASGNQKVQKLQLLLDEGLGALKRCEYLRAHVAARLAMNLSPRCVEAPMVMTVAAAGLGLWQQMDINLRRVQKETALRTASTLWLSSWALSLLGDWSRAEALLWQLVQKEPDNATFLILLSLARSQRGKLQSAIIDCKKAASLQPGETECTKLLIRLLLDSGRCREAEKRLAPIQASAVTDPEVSMLIVRLRLAQKRVDEAVEFASVLRSADNSPHMLIRLGEVFEGARCDGQAEEFFTQALENAFYPEALIGQARLAARRKENDKARELLLCALDLEKPIGPHGRPVTELFQAVVNQLAFLDGPQENCGAWIATFPAEASPSILAKQSLMVFARNRAAGERCLDAVLRAMQPSSPTTPATQLQWKDAPEHQQPARPVPEGIQYVVRTVSDKTPSKAQKKEKTRKLILGVVFAALVAAVYIMNFRSRPAAPQPQQNVHLWPLTDEDAASAQKPLSEVLDSLNLKAGTRTFNIAFRSRLRHRQFHDLDVAMDQLRKSKARMPGGEWQLFDAYGLMSEPSAGWDAPDSEWEKQLHLLEEWISASPDSITARVAYASALLNYAWKTRGDGLADEVSKEQSKLFLDRHRQAEQVLKEAERLPVRCPQWYYLALRIGMVFSWKRGDYDRLFNEAVAFEPLYNRYYAAKADYLLPQWHGRDGEWQDFLRKTGNDIGGDEGSVILYRGFRFVGSFLGATGWKQNVRRLWPDLKRGYHAIDNLYGVSSQDLNEYAEMAYTAADRKEARAAFQKIQDRWDNDVWDDQKSFDKAKKWALSGPGN